MALSWYVRTMQGRYVTIEVDYRLCPVCRAVEWVTTENSRFVSLTYPNGAPVLHKR